MQAEQINVSTASASTWSIRVDNNLNRAIIEVKSSEGQVIRQYPTEAQLKAFARAEALKAARQHEVNAELNAKLAAGSPEGSAPEVNVSAPSAPTSAPAPDSGPAGGGGSNSPATTTQSIEV